MSKVPNHSIIQWFFIIPFAAWCQVIPITPSRDDTVFKGVDFKITLATNTATLGSTNILHCYIKNDSTNTIAFRLRSKLDALVLEDHAGNEYYLAVLGTSDHASVTNHPVSLKVGDTYQWFACFSVTHPFESVDTLVKHAGFYRLRTSEVLAAQSGSLKSNGGYYSIKQSGYADLKVITDD